jgi:hypothetical protein
MRQVLDDCSIGCCSALTSTFLPTRLIDLGTGDRDDCIRLIQTADTQLQPPTRYAALSYCWGTKEQAALQLTTTSANLRQRLGAILFEDMTAVMQDMVRTARALSIRYAWIDALCILQGDVEDWMKESERMGLVYTHAFVTVCTLTAFSCLEGFLQRPPPIKIASRSFLQPNIHGMLNVRYQSLRETFTFPYTQDLLKRDSGA